MLLLIIFSLHCRNGSKDEMVESEKVENNDTTSIDNGKVSEVDDDTETEKQVEINSDIQPPSLVKRYQLNDSIIGKIYISRSNLNM